MHVGTHRHAAARMTRRRREQGHRWRALVGPRAPRRGHVPRVGHSGAGGNDVRHAQVGVWRGEGVWWRGVVPGGGGAWLPQTNSISLRAPQTKSSWLFFFAVRGDFWEGEVKWMEAKWRVELSGMEWGGSVIDTALPQLCSQPPLVCMFLTTCVPPSPPPCSPPCPVIDSPSLLLLTHRYT
jgi:hypothetical protein